MFEVFIITLVFLFGCAHKQNPEPAPDTVPLSFDQAATRMLDMSDHGWIVSRWQKDYAMEDVGDSLLWTGIALGVLDCKRAQLPQDALIEMIREQNGGLFRHPSLPGEWSMDGAIGLWWGVSKHVKRCPQDYDIWNKAFFQHQGWAFSHVNPIFNPAIAQVASEVGLTEAPSGAQTGQLGASMVGWAFGVMQTRATGYRLHLAYLLLDILDAPKSKDAYCSTVKGSDIPLIEHFCGRDGLAPWLEGYSYNVYVYRHQMAIWQDPDGHPALNTPGLDYLAGLVAE